MCDDTVSGIAIGFIVMAALSLAFFIGHCVGYSYGEAAGVAREQMRASSAGAGHWYAAKESDAPIFKYGPMTPEASK